MTNFARFSIFASLALLIIVGCTNKKGTSTTTVADNDSTAVDTYSLETDTVTSDNEEFIKIPSDLIPHFKAVNKAIADGDAKAFASMIFYPIHRDYPLRWIEDSAQMVASFHTLIDDSIRSIFKKAKPEDWQGGGWRGYSIGLGDFWDSGDGIYQINYYSKASLRKQEKLVKEEMSTLHPLLRGSKYKPYACYIDGKTHAVMRLDWYGEDGMFDKYRMCVYNDRRKLRERPDMILDVTRDVQGSAAVQWFTCSLNENGRKKKVMVFYVDYTEREDGFDATVYKGKKEEKHTLYRTYWLDLINRRK